MWKGGKFKTRRRKGLICGKKELIYKDQNVKCTVYVKQRNQNLWENEIDVKENSVSEKQN